ncbi:MAG TPA: alpha-L-fucosidase [Cyclobacteriaceae bacterium]|nr:alpha-L-fucosidase [Cyclobacteriaceae bacterium]
MTRLFSLLSVVFLIACSKPVKPPEAIQPVPTQAQLDWHDMKMNAFIHFTINTFTDREWGMGSESPKEFNPTELNVDQWISVLKETGFKGVILTCKHHDGFCLWPSKFTDHDIENSPFMNGKGDIVKLVSDACKKNGLKFGVYLSPWDRNHKDYGKLEYITYYRNQLNELFDAYGPVFEMWFDGANGGDGYYGGANEKRRIDGSTYYDWPTTLDLVRGKNPDIIFFSDAGPGVRWVGNERGVAGETNWNNISTDTLYAGKAGIETLLNTGDENGTSWVPAETDVSIRKGWFYHASEDSLVKSPERLFEIYLSSVGRGSVLLLNIPPDRRGLFHEEDVKSLRGFKELLDKEFKTNLAATAEASASRNGYDAANMTDNNPETYWATEDDITKASITLTLTRSTAIKYVVLKEYIKLGQRVKSFDIEYKSNGSWTRLASGTTIGHERILKVSAETDAIRVNITDSRACPVISSIEVY